MKDVHYWAKIKVESCPAENDEQAFKDVVQLQRLIAMLRDVAKQKLRGTRFYF